MNKPVNITTKPIYYHDCPALGSHTTVLEALMVSTDGTIVSGRQHKCPFCSYTADEFHPSTGVTMIAPGKYEVDMSKAERVEEVK